MATNMKTLHEIAARATSVMPRGGTAQLVPLPVRHRGALRAAVLEYRRSHDPRVPLVLYPPHRVLLLDPDSALLCDEGDDRVPWLHDQPLQGESPPRASSVADFLTKRERLDALAQSVWNAFASDTPTLEDDGRRAAAEYVALSEGTEPLLLRPYMRKVGADFYGWLRRIGALPNGEP
jgi:hypothetical protein